MHWREMVHWENGMKYSSLSESESTGRSVDACHLLTVVTHRNGSTCTDLGEGGGDSCSIISLHYKININITWQNQIT